MDGEKQAGHDSFHSFPCCSVPGKSSRRRTADYHSLLGVNQLSSGRKPGWGGCPAPVTCGGPGHHSYLGDKKAATPTAKVCTGRWRAWVSPPTTAEGRRARYLVSCGPAVSFFI